MADLKAATPDTTDAAFDKISKDIGLKMDKAKVAAIIKANISARFRRAELKAELQDAVSENYYNGVILSLIKRYCPAGLWAWR